MQSIEAMAFFLEEAANFFVVLDTTESDACKSGSGKTQGQSNTLGKIIAVHV